MQSQLSYVGEQLKKNGRISRNQCLGRRITRLGALIKMLQYAGWTFLKPERYYTSSRNWDYIYYLKKAK